MNDQIRQLAKQAGYSKDYLEIGLPSNMEKFAELIVQECAGLFVDQKYMILNPHEPFANERVRALKKHDRDTVRKIKQHFGVEE